MRLKLLSRLWLIPAISSLAVGAWAADAAPAMKATDPITVNQALEIAFRNNPDLRIATDAVNRSVGVVAEARARFNPTLSSQIVQLYQGPAVSVSGAMTGGQDVTITPPSQKSARASVFLPLDAFGRLRYSSDIAHDQFQISYLSLLRTSQQLIAQVKRNYYEVLRTCGQADTAQAAVDVAAVRLKNTDARYKEGTVPKFDVTTAQVDLANLNQNLILARSRVNIAQANFNRVLGISPNASTQVVKSAIPIDLASVDIVEADKTAKAQRPEVKIQQMSIALSKTNIALQRTGAKPSLGIQGNYNYVSAQSFSSSNMSYDAAITLSVPIWDGGVTKAKVDQAYADLYSATDTLAQVELVVSQEVSTAALVLEEAAKRTTSTAESVALAEEALRLANVRYEAGIAVLVEVTNAESQLTQARFNLVNAQYDYAIALAELQRATSTQPETASLQLCDYRPALNLTQKPVTN